MSIRERTLNLDRILKELKDERERLSQAINALEGAQSRDSRVSHSSGSPAAKRGRRTMSAAVRKKISRAAKKRWAELKKKQAA